MCVSADGSNQRSQTLTQQAHCKKHAYTGVGVRETTWNVPFDQSLPIYALLLAWWSQSPQEIKWEKQLPGLLTKLLRNKSTAGLGGRSVTVNILYIIPSRHTIYFVCFIWLDWTTGGQLHRCYLIYSYGLVQCHVIIRWLNNQSHNLLYFKDPLECKNCTREPVVRFNVGKPNILCN